MEWSPQQEKALALGREWVRSIRRGRPNQKKFEVFGYAGTGKSTLVKTFVEEMGADVDDVLYVAPTGKAAKVMQSKGCPGAMTIHRALYKVSQPSTARLEELIKDLEKTMKSDANDPGVDLLRQEIADEEKRMQRLNFIPNAEAPAYGAKLIVIDEASMVGAKIGRDLVATGVPLLIMGDPGQLPPIQDSAFFMEDEPDVLLTEIHRQAADSGILQLATLIRQGGDYRVGSYGSDCRVVNRGAEGNRALAVAADQMLVGRNASRRDANYTLRQDKGRSGPFPVKGDKLICLQNNNEIDIVNGSQWLCVDPGRRQGQYVDNVEVLPLDGGRPHTLPMHAGIFGGEPVSRKDWRTAEHFDHAEAVTVHKAQGSQWDTVYMLDESSSFDRRWLYTGITRAAKDFTLVRL